MGEGEDSLAPKCRHLFFPVPDLPGVRYCTKCGGSASADWVRGWIAGQMVGKVSIPDPKTGPNVNIVVDEKNVIPADTPETPGE